MNTTSLGRTGLQTSVAGLGCGGPSRLGASSGGSQEDAESVVRTALDLGITFIDTAEAYGTEEAVGNAIPRERRDEIVVCTKVSPRDKDKELIRPQRFRERALACLQRLRTERLELLYVHGVSAADYPYTRDVLLPVIQSMRGEGLVRFAAISEAFASDPGHAMLTLAVQDPGWNAFMVGFNLLNQSARERVIGPAAERGIAIVLMFAVRRALRSFEPLMAVHRDLKERGLLPAPDDEPLDAFLKRHGMESVPDMAYRFCRHEPGVDVVLTGTGNIDHLRANVQSINAGPLPAEVIARLKREFAGVDSVSGN